MTVINSKGYPDAESLALVSDLQYHEPFNSGAVNRKGRGIIKKGIYLGLNPVAGDGLTVTLKVDSTDGGGTASFDIGDYYQLTIRQQKNISVTLEAGTTKIIALQATYALGTETYQVNSESTIQAAEIVLLASGTALASNQLELCTVTIPSSTTQITSDMINVSNRVARAIGIELSNSLTSNSESVAASSNAVYLLKTYVDDALADKADASDTLALSDMSCFSAIGSTAQSIPAATATAIIFATENFDDLSEYSPSTGKFTAKNDGYYEFFSSVHCESSTQMLRVLWLYVNGVEKKYMAEFNPQVGGIAIVGNSGVVKLSAGDYVQIYYYTGSADTTRITSSGTWFSGRRVK
jgi:hypothetical protein